MVRRFGLLNTDCSLVRESSRWNDFGWFECDRARHRKLMSPQFLDILEIAVKSFADRYDGIRYESSFGCVGGRPRSGMGSDGLMCEGLAETAPHHYRKRSCATQIAPKPEAGRATDAHCCRLRHRRRRRRRRYYRSEILLRDCNRSSAMH